jgi:nicotinamidase-related amidase
MKKAFVVIDYQVDFVTGSLGFPEASSLDVPLAHAIEAYRAQGWDILFTLDTHGPDYLATAWAVRCLSLTASKALTGTNYMGARPRHCMPGTAFGKRKPLAAWHWRSIWQPRAMIVSCWLALWPISVC